MAPKGPLFPIFDWQRALLYSDLPKETKTVGWALSTFTNKHGGNAHPGEAKLAGYLSMTPRTVRTHLTRLRADGFIIRVDRGSIAERRAWADVYQLAIPGATTGSGFPEVPEADHRSLVSGDEGADPWASEADHRKSEHRPPETERTDHRKLVSAQQRSASTHTYKASDSAESAPHASERSAADPLGYNDLWTSDEERMETVRRLLGGGDFRVNEEPAVSNMIYCRQPLGFILNTVRSSRGETAA
jgi:DNA-binding transcriptional ArsR family regulator